MIRKMEQFPSSEPADLEHPDVGPERLERSFWKRGDTVFVKRSDGRMDSGWKIETFFEYEGENTVVLTKMDNGDLKSRTISYEQLYEWNPVAQTGEGPIAQGKKTEALKSPESSKVRDFRRGDTVAVRRSPESGGRIEYDWTIKGFDNTTGDAIVRKPNPKGEGYLQKRMSREELEEINKGFRTFKEWHDLFMQNGGVYGQDDYSRSDIPSLSQKMRAEEAWSFLCSKFGVKFDELPRLKNIFESYFERN